MKPNLFLLHFAGGNRYSFNFLNHSLRQHFNLIPLELPGRGMRLSEPFCSNMEEAANDLLDQILLINQDRPYYIFGHSLGSMLGLLVTQKLEILGKPPIYLITSGNCGPGLKGKKYYRNLYKLPDSQFIDCLKLMGGLPEAVFTNTELMNFFLPIIKADFRLLSETQPKYQILDTPIYALMGDEEEMVGQIHNWSNYTNTFFDCTVFSGKHFFIYDHPTKIAQIFKYLKSLDYSKIKKIKSPVNS